MSFEMNESFYYRYNIIMFTRNQFPSVQIMNALIMIPGPTVLPTLFISYG